MSKSPRGSTKVAQQENAACLQAPFLRSASSGQLLGRCLEIHHALDAAQAPLPLDKAFIDELLKKEYLQSSNGDVQAVLASIFADLLRLSAGASATSLPFSPVHAHEVLKLFCVTFATIRGINKPSSAHLIHARHAIDKLAQSHALHRLVSGCHPHSGDAVDQDVAGLFQTFLHEFLTTTEDTSFLSRIAVVLADCIAATHTVTDTQLQLLLSSIAPAQRQVNPTGAAVAIAVLRRHEDLLSTVVSTQVMHDFNAGVAELKNIEMTDGTPAERRSALKQVAQALETVVELAKVGTTIISQVVPALQSSLLAESLDVRVLVVRGFSKLFLVSIHIAGHFMPAYNLFLSRFSDTKGLVKQDMLKFAQSSLLASPTEGNWVNLAPLLEAKLVDGEEGVRRTAISVVCELAVACASSIPKGLVEAVGHRCADKNPKVRQHATERLTQLYKGIQYHWIPDAIFLALHGEGGVVSVELGLEDMLPPPTKVADSAESARKSRSAKDKEHAVFDFELAASDGNVNGDHAVVSEEALQAAAQKATFVDGFCKLCGDLNERNWPILLTLMGKKPNLRRTIDELFIRRNKIKEIGNIDTPEGKEAMMAIHRLLAFLQQITHSKKGEWDVIFRAKDEKVSKAFREACDQSVLDYHKAGLDLVSKLKGRISPDAQTFVQQSLTRRMFLPFSKAHIEELAARITSERGLPCSKRQGSIRAAQCVMAFAPQLSSLLVPVLIDTLAIEASREQPSESKSPLKLGGKGAKAEAAAAQAEARSKEQCAQQDLLLLVLQTLSGRSSGSDESAAHGDAGGANLSAQSSKTLITAIGRMCIQHPVPKIAKTSAAALVHLFPTHVKAFQQLFSAVRDKLRVVAAGNEELIPQVASWLQTATVLATLPKAAVVPEEFLSEVTPVLYFALRAASADDGLDTKSKKLVPDATTAHSVSAMVADACCKSLTRIALHQPGAKAAALVPMVAAELISAYRETRHLPTGSVGACKKRLAIVKQLIKLVSRPGHKLDLATELTTAVLSSAEDNADVRQVLQTKIALHFKQQKSDVTMLAILLLGAISEDTRSGYMRLRALVHAAGDRMRQQQASESVMLGDVKALHCYAEYAIPTLVLFLAHHTFFAVERESQFLSYQRVWHLLFDELFRHGAGCASFCQEMLRKIKQLDDSLDTDSTATRMLCDLASKVMLECLGQKSVRAESLKPYPGVVLLPRFFVKPKDASRFPADVIYLDNSVTVGPHPPFKQVFGAATPGRSVGATSTSAPPAGDNEEAGAEASDTHPRTLDYQHNEQEDDEERNAAAPVSDKKLSSSPKAVTSPHQKSRGASSSTKKRLREDDNDDDADEADAKEEQIMYQSLSKLCKSITREVFETLSWKKVKRDLEEAIGKKLTDAQITFAQNTLRELAPRV